MKHTMLLASTGVLVGLLSAFVGLPPLVERSLWAIIYVLWVFYALRVNLEMPVRRLAFTSTMAALLAGSAQVLFMEKYKANNPWHADFFESNSVQELATDLLVRGIAFGVVCGIVVGLLVGWRQRSQAA